MSRLNLHKLLKGAAFSPGLLKRIDVDPTERSLLMSARTDIREHIRKEFSRISEVFDTRAIFTEAYYRDHRKNLEFGDTIEFKAKFATQGSFQYKTVNWPAHVPPQEVDLDDGIYVAMPYYNGQPVLEPNTYFEVVERALVDLCHDKGWEMDFEKSSCVRIKLSTGNSHIDLPLYGVPTEEFDRVTKEMASQKIDPTQVAFAEAMRDWQQLRIDHSQVKLATRNEGWISSDPQELNDWFNRAIEDHGEQLREVCRFLKAWRDYTLIESKLSSIALMTVVVEAYDKGFGITSNERPASNRVDLALQKTAGYLVDALATKIENPSIPISQRDLSAQWSPIERSDYIAAATQLKVSIDDALNVGYHKGNAIAKLKTVFGERVPDNQSLIENDTSPIEEVLSTQAATQPIPEISTHKSG